LLDDAQLAKELAKPDSRLYTEDDQRTRDDDEKAENAWPLGDDDARDAAARRGDGEHEADTDNSEV
jgi:hypothetical protein